MAEQKLSSLQQAYAEKNRVLKNNEGATESRRAALSAVSGRSILKTKEETEKMRRNEEIAVRVSAANIEGAAASGAVTMEKAKASAAAQLDKTKRNEVLSILKMGIYDPSFPSILGFREDVVKNFADKKAREIEERKAIKKASENARQEYEQALAEIQNIKKVAGTYNGDEVHIETPKNTEEARKALDIAAKRATDPSISVNTVSLITQQVMDPIRDAIWSGEGRSDGRSAARAAATKTEPISAAKQKALQEEKLKQAEQRAAAMKAAKDRYEEILAKRIKKKQALNQELTGLEKQTVESPAGRIRLARQELEHATANEREEAFSNYTDQVTGGIQEAALAASAAIEQIAVKTERAEELNDAEKETLNAQRDQLQQMIRALERELKETDLSIEGQDFLVEQKENLNLLLESVETGINYAAHYEENKEQQLRSQEESEPKKDAGYLRRKLLRESGISKEGQSVYYCAVMASESELELIEQLAETDADIGEVCEALMKIKDADSLASGSYASNRKRDAIAQTNLSDEAKIEIYRATISKTRNEEIQSFSDAGLDFNSFLKAQNEYSSIGEKYKKAAEKATAFSSWIEQQPYTEEQKEAIRENFKYYSQIPVEATTYNKLTDSGISDEISRNIADKLSGLEPEAGEEKITIVQKYRAIAEADIPDADKRKAIEAIAADTDIKRLQIVYKYHISLDQFIAVKENLAKLDKEATGTSGISGATVEASINKVNGLSIEQCGALWQAFVSSKSAKNNPYSVEVGQEVLNAVKNNYE